MLPAGFKIPALKTPAKILISVVILGLIIARMDPDSAREAVGHIHAWAWIYAVLFVLLQLALLSWRWMVLVNIGRRRLRYVDSLQITIASMLANMLFITSVSGIFVRVAMALQYGASLGKALLATAVDRLMTLAALVLLCMIFLPALGRYLENDLHRTLAVYVGGFGFLLFIFAPVFAGLVLKNISRAGTIASWMPKVMNYMDSGIRYIRALLGGHTRLAGVATISLAAQVCFFVSVYILSISAGLPLSFLQLMTVLPFVALVASLPISFGGWGVREGAFIYGLGLLGVPMETAFLISVQVGITGILATVLAGIPALMAEGSGSFGTGLIRYKAMVKKALHLRG